MGGNGTIISVLLVVVGCGHTSATTEQSSAGPGAGRCREAQQTLVSRYRGSFDAEKGGWPNAPQSDEVGDMELALGCADLGHDRCAGVAQKVLLRRASMVDGQSGALLSPNGQEEDLDKQREFLGLFERAHALFGTGKFQQAAHQLSRHLAGRGRVRVAQSLDRTVK